VQSTVPRLYARIAAAPLLTATRPGTAAPSGSTRGDHLFGVDFENLDLAHVEAFLAEAGEEGVTWEAKADDDDERKRPGGEAPGRLKPRTIQKAASGIANQIGGFLILGARWDKAAKRWRLPGIVVDDAEPVGDPPRCVERQPPGVAWTHERHLVL
jgi:hypothetical protein